MNHLMIEKDDDLKSFFDELKDCYDKEGVNFSFDWSEIKKYSTNPTAFVYYIAYNLSKNVLHGPLPDHLHSRMIFEKNRWTKEYFKHVNPE